MPQCASDSASGKGIWFPNQLRIWDRVVGRGKGIGGDEGGAVAGVAGDALGERRFNVDCAHT
jgi:hypothetical protein